MNNTIVLMLAGGIGKRFWPLGKSKSLFVFLGKPLIVHNLEKLAAAGFERVCIVTTPENESEIKSISVPGLSITTRVQTEPNGMAGAVLSAADAISDQPLLIMNAEDVVEASLYERISAETQKNEPFVVGKTVQEYIDVGYVTASDDRVVSVVEKPGAGNEPSDTIYLVFNYYPNSSNFLSILKTTTSDRDDVFEVANSTYVKETPVRLLRYDGLWHPTKYPWHILEVMDYFLDHELTDYRGKNLEIKSNVTIEGPVWIGDNVRIFENSKITGPCYIGDNTIVGSNNIIRRSHLGENCVTGFNTDITRSYIGNNCWFHSNYIGDSVLEGDVSLGSGTTIANLRLDEQEIFSQIGEHKISTRKTKFGAIIGSHVRIGVNTSIMPGRKIGANSLIGAGIIIERDIATASFAYGKVDLVITKNEKAHENKSRDEFRNKI